jgi:hypothetical protein
MDKNNKTNYHQIFKSCVPQELTLELLDKISLKENGFWVITYEKYKQGIHTGIIQDFFSACIPYYHISKQHYITRKLNYTKVSYSNLLTVLRQICNNSNINWRQNSKYFNGVANVYFLIQQNTDGAYKTNY